MKRSDATLLATFCFSYPVNRRGRKRGRVHLQGYDKEARCEKTAAAVVFSKKCCMSPRKGMEFPASSSATSAFPII